MENCSVCGKELKSFIEIDSKKICPECFVCAGCGKSIAEEKYQNKDGKNYCQSCLKDMAPKCKICGKTIEGPVKKLGNDHYHPECLKCSSCGDVLTG